MTMLCSLLPVKYISAEEYSASLTTRRSDWMPPSSSTLALVSPLASTFSTPGWLVKNSMTSAGCLDEASRSMSPMISLCRRRLPAALHRMTSGCDRSASSSGSARRSASLIRWREA